MKGPAGDQEVAGHGGLLQERGRSVAVHRLKLPWSGAVRCLVEIVFP
jgi:hypothetical protein